MPLRRLLLIAGAALSPTATLAAASPAARVFRPATPLAPAPAVTYSTDWSNTTPAYRQNDLLGGYACAPTATAMVTAHFAAVRAAAMHTPDEFVAELQPVEFIPGEGVPFQALVRQLGRLGYTRISGNTGNSKAALIAELVSGPVVITAGGDTIGQRGLHSLVVVAISDDGNYALINDPETGRQVELPWSTVDALWAGGSYGIFLVRP